MQLPEKWQKGLLASKMISMEDANFLDFTDVKHRLMQRLHGWFALTNPGLEEAVLRTFHPQGPLSPLFAAMAAPAELWRSTKRENPWKA